MVESKIKIKLQFQFPYVVLVQYRYHTAADAHLHCVTMHKNNIYIALNMAETVIALS